MKKYTENPFYEWKIPVGTKIKFRSEKQKYIVRASNKFFLICTKPFNIQKTVIYTIVDLVNNIRWPENTIFGFWAETNEQCKEMLERLTEWESEISQRRSIRVDIEYFLIP